MKDFKFIAIIIVLGLLFGTVTGCSVSNHVNDGGLFQKRKHNKGWFLNKNNSDFSVNKGNRKSENKPKEGIAENDTGKKNTEAVSPVNNLPTKNILDKNKISSQNELIAITGDKKKDAKSGKIETDVNPVKKKDHFSKKVRTDTYKNRNLAMETFEETNSSQAADGMKILILILCFIISPVAVALMTNNLFQTLLNLLLYIIFWLPGTIHALIIFFKKY